MFWNIVMILSIWVILRSIVSLKVNDSLFHRALREIDEYHESHRGKNIYEYRRGLDNMTWYEYWCDDIMLPYVNPFLWTTNQFEEYVKYMDAMRKSKS